MHDPRTALRSGDLLSQTRNLLLVEDDRRVGSFIAQGLRDEGFHVEWATTADEALAHATAGSFDVMLLDHMLPGRSGIEVARALRANGNATPILMLTARDAPEDRRAAFAAGANEFMGKPFLFDDLLARIAKLIAA
jgi:DNA-binding response OmpR family regulator